MFLGVAAAATPLVISAARDAILPPDGSPQKYEYLVHLDQASLSNNSPRWSNVSPGTTMTPEPGKLGTFLPQFIPDGINRARWAFSLWLGEKIDQEEERTYGFHHDPALMRKLRQIITRLKQVSLRPQDPILFRILDTDDLEEIAEASSSTIYFGKAYLNLPPSEDELMFVTAHEMAHIELNHSFLKAANETNLKFRSILHSIKNRIASSIFLMNGPDPGENERKIRNEIERGRYSQAREREADLWGAKFAVAAGASPAGIKETLDRFQVSREQLQMIPAHAPAEGNLDTRRLTHPLPPSRLKFLEEALGPKFWEKGLP